MIEPGAALPGSPSSRLGSRQEPAAADTASRNRPKQATTTHHAKGAASRPRTQAQVEKAAAAAAARARAAERDREEWEARRGAGSDVVIWYDKNRKNEDFVNHFGWDSESVIPRLRDVIARPSTEQTTSNMDRLLTWGIGDYTVLPKILGRGRFSSVFLAEKNGERVAIKHTPLFPHHHLIATRLLREPNLLAELPPHANLVSVKETIRTPGHFYLVEEYLEGYITLESLTLRSELRNENGAHILAPAVAERIFCQLLFALHAIHCPLRVCHRDVKPENILVHPETLQLKLLDFGLATHFSKSRPKLTTCCGSPAFHCPEIVVALGRAPGTVAYWGPEFDAWACGLTILRCLSGLRYPLGTSHNSPASMKNRAKQALSLVKPHTLREQIALLLDMDGEKRMRHFEDLVQHYLARQKDVAPAVRKMLKSTSFIPTAPQHKIPLPLLDSPEPSTRSSFDGASFPSPYSELTLINYTRMPSVRVLSFVKYCLRCAGILYHSLPVAEWPECSTPFSVSGRDTPISSGSSHVLQCVLELPPQANKSLLQSFMQALGFRESPQSEQSLLQKPSPTPQSPQPPQSPNEIPVNPASGPSGRRGEVRTLVFYLYVFFARKPYDNPPLFEPERQPDSVISGDSSTEIVPVRPLSTRVDDSADLVIDTHPERINTSSTRMRPRAKSRATRGTRVRVFVSDQRAFPQVREALSAGGIVDRSEADEISGLEALAHAHSRNNSVHDLGTTTPGTMTPRRRDSLLPPPLRTTLQADELAIRLDAISTARDAALASRWSASPDAMQHAQELNTLVARLYIYVDGAANCPDPTAAEALQEQNFTMLDVLAPTLALVSSFDTAHPQQLPDGSVLEVKTTGCLSLAILESVARITSVKEMLLGIQEQIERVCVQETEEKDVDEAGDFDGPSSDPHAHKIQELLGLIRLLTSLHPQVRTRRIRAMIQPAIELLYPMVFRDVIARELVCIRERELAEELATQGTMLLCEFVISVNTRLEQTDSHRIVRDLLTELFIGGICAIFGSLPHTGGVHDGNHGSPTIFVAPDRETHVSWRITVWNVVRKTLEEIGLDLGKEALGDWSPVAAQNAFLLMTQQIAYELFMSSIKRRSRDRLAIVTADSSRLGEPSRWTRDTAVELLERTARVTPTSLFPGLTRLDAEQSSSALAVVTSSFTSDAYCMLATWSLDALDRAGNPKPLANETVIPIVRALCLTAANAPEVHLRSESFTSASRLLCNWCGRTTAMELLGEMFCGDPPLAASAVNLVREMCAKCLESMPAAKHGVDTGDTTADDTDVIFTCVWQWNLFKLPPLPNTADELVPFLVRYTTLLTEYCSLYYYLYTRDTNGTTGARKHHPQIEAQFIAPLSEWTRKWHSEANDAHWLGLIEVGLARINETVEAHSTEQ